MTFIEGHKVNLRPLTSSDIGEKWLGWLNNPVLLKYRGPKAFPSTLSDLHRYLANSNGDLRLAVTVNNEHVGNISLGSINWVHGTAEVNVLIGESAGQGHGTDAVAALARHAFGNMGLSRLWAESPNPAFGKIMTKLKWTFEGAKREAFLLDGQRVDIQCWGILAREFYAQAREGDLSVVEQNPLQDRIRKIESGQLAQGKGRADERGVRRENHPIGGFHNQGAEVVSGAGRYIEKNIRKTKQFLPSPG